MKRKEFFKYLGLGAAATVVAPKLIAEAIEEVKDEHLFDMKKLKDQLEIAKQAPKGEWYEESRLHWRRFVTIVSGGDDIKVSVPVALKLQLNDVVLMDDQNFLVKSITDFDFNAGFYEPLDVLEFYGLTGNLLMKADNDEPFQIVYLMPYRKLKKPFKAGDQYVMMLVGNDYAPGTGDAPIVIKG